VKRVLFLDHSAQLGGAELSLQDLARSQRDCRVLLFADGPFRERLTQAGVDVEVIAAPARMVGVRRESRFPGAAAIPGIASLAWRVAATARPFDLIHCNSQKAFVVGILAGLLARRPVVWHLRDMLTHSGFSRVNRRLAVTLANRLASLVLTNSRATAEAFAAAGGHLTKTAVLYNGLDLPQPTAQAVESRRNELGLGGRHPILGCFSRLSPWKGQHVLIQSAAQLRDRYPNVQVLLVGSPLFGEDAYEADLHRLVASHGLEGNVRFLGFRSDIAELMALCDLIVHTSTEPEPFGRVIVEGQLAGKAVIATRGGGASELVKDAETGLLVPPGDAASLAAAIVRLTGSDGAGLAARLAEQGRTHALREFSVAVMVERYGRLLARMREG